jgi:hypothetical protein
MGSWGYQAAQGMLGPMLPIPQPQADQILKQLNGLQAKPLTLFASAYKNLFEVKLSVPIDPILKIRDVVMAAMAAPPPAAP